MSLGEKLVPLALALALGATASAGPLEDLRPLTLLPEIDLAKLKAGEIVTERGALGEFSRGIHLETCYFVKAPMDAVGSALLHWDPVRHRDPEVRLYHEYPFPGGAAGAFKTLSSTPVSRATNGCSTKPLAPPRRARRATCTSRARN